MGVVPFILVKDEIKVKSAVSWEPKWDTLVGLCGSKVDHICVLSYKRTIGSREQGYSNILDHFRTNKMGGFARVIVVNLLHEKLPCLVLEICCTCNCFDASWVRDKQNRIDKMWQVHCHGTIGPIVGHHGDGDSHKRHLMQRLQNL